MNLEWFQLSFDMHIVHVGGKLSFFKILHVKVSKISASNLVTLAWPHGKTTVHRMLLKVFIGVLRCQVSFETMFWLIFWKWGCTKLKNYCVLIPPPPWSFKGKRSLVWLGLKEILTLKRNTYFTNCTKLKRLFFFTFWDITFEPDLRQKYLVPQNQGKQIRTLHIR